jgi:hypothetical protein
MAEYLERWNGEEGTEFVSDVDKNGKVVDRELF